MQCGSPNWFSRCGGLGGVQCGAPASGGEGCEQHGTNNCIMCYQGIGMLLKSGSSFPNAVFNINAVLCNDGTVLEFVDIKKFDMILLINHRRISGEEMLKELIDEISAAIEAGSEFRYEILRMRPYEEKPELIIFDNAVIEKLNA